MHGSEHVVADNRGLEDKPLAAALLEPLCRANFSKYFCACVLTCRARASKPSEPSLSEPSSADASCLMARLARMRPVTWARGTGATRVNE